MRTLTLLRGFVAVTLVILALAGVASALEVGQKAPDFSLMGTDGKPVKLSDLTAKGPVVIYTFIAAFTPTWTKELQGFEAALPQFEAAGAQVVGISTDHHLALAAWQKDQSSKQVLLSDFRRQMLPAYGAMQTNEASPVYRYAKRAYFIVDKTGTLRFQKVMDNSLDLLDPAEVLNTVKTSGLWRGNPAVLARLTVGGARTWASPVDLRVEWRKRSGWRSASLLVRADWVIE
jgi:peroxiredoxin